jgi:hypothetical protein
MSDNDQQVTSQDNTTSAAPSNSSNTSDRVQPLPEPDPALMHRITESTDRDRNSEKV